nr:transposase [Streptomyces sp. NRRL S-337]
MLPTPVMLPAWPAVLVADTGYGANADFRRDLEDRRLAYVLQANGEMTAHGEEAVPHQPDYGGLGPKPLPATVPGRCPYVSTYGLRATTTAGP